MSNAMNLQKKPLLLAVDDEPEVLYAIQDQMESDFEVHIASNGKSALKIIEQFPDLAVVLSDQRMPGMTGADFLAEATKYSEAVPVMITGYADIEAVIKSINEGQLFAYVTKPWDESELRVTLHRASERHELLQALKHEEKLLNNLMSNIPDEIYFKDIDHKFLRINTATANSLGLVNTKHAIGKLQDDLDSDQLRIKRIHEEDREILKTGKSIIVDEKRQLGEGKVQWVSKSKVPIRDANGAINGIVGIARDITERKMLEKDLDERKVLLQQVVENLPVGVCVADKEGRLIVFNHILNDIWAGKKDVGVENYGEYKGWWADTGVRLKSEDWALARALTKGVAVYNDVVDIECFDGSRKTIEVAAIPLFSQAGEQDGALAVIDDITLRRKQEQRIARLTRTQAMHSGFNSAIVRMSDREQLFDEVERLALNPGCFSLFSIRLVDDISEKLSFFAGYGPEAFTHRTLDLEKDATLPQIVAFNTRKPNVCNDLSRYQESFSRFFKSKKGSAIKSLLCLPILNSRQLKGVICFGSNESDMFDAAEIRLLEELASDLCFALEHIEQSDRIQYLAYYNPLTDLANRALLEERLEQFLGSAKRTDKVLALALFDIIGFRNINSSFGRHAGDKVLQQIADRLLEQVSEANQIAHIGIDQFAVIFPDLGTEDCIAAEMRLRIERVFEHPFSINDTEVILSARAGIALFPTDGENSQLMMTNSEAALKRAKRSNDRVVFFEQRMTERVAERITLENRLRRAIEREEFLLYFQPKYACHNNAIVGVEALIRWQSPDLGMVSPAEFIPVLEETGLILNVGEWVIREAVRVYHDLTQQGLQVPRIAVNVSALQLNQPDFVERVKVALQLKDDSSNIDLEITESLIMDNVEDNINKLRELNSLGIRIAIDDFGTGYSSLSYLSRLPADYLKIDQSFVASMNEDPRAMTLVSTIISLAHSLEMKVIAEGVETEEQARILRLLRCDQKQGFLLSKPLPQEAFTRLLLAQQSEIKPHGSNYEINK